VSASATSGTATATVGTNTVTWNGSIPSGGSVTITINANVSPTASGTVSNQGTVNIDIDNDGTNETPVLTQAPGGGPTTFSAAAAGADIPALSPLMLLALAAMLSVLAARKLMAS